MSDVKRVAQIACKSEWALARFFDAIFYSLSDRFELTTICDVEHEPYGAINGAIKNRIEDIRLNAWRSEQRLKEIKSLADILCSLGQKEIDYKQVNGNCTLPKEVYDNCDMVVIHSPNTTHLNYAEDALNHGKNVVCEKPLCSLLRDKDRGNLNKLEELVNQAEEKKLQFLDAEHYSYKKQSMIFYDKAEELIKDGWTVTRVSGEIAEIDNPELERTKSVLSKKNGTGLLLDTGVHLMSFMSSLGAEYENAKAKFGYKGYDVDTFCDFGFNLTGRRFNRRAELRVVKFIDKLSDRKEYEDSNGNVKESKYIEFIFSRNGETATLKANWTGKKVEFNGQELQGDYHENECVNFFNHIDKCRTSARNSLKNLKVISELYQKIDSSVVSVYV